MAHGPYKPPPGLHFLQNSIVDDHSANWNSILQASDASPATEQPTVGEFYSALSLALSASRPLEPFPSCTATLARLRSRAATLARLRSCEAIFIQLRNLNKFQA